LYNYQKAMVEEIFPLDTRPLQIYILDMKTLIIALALLSGCSFKNLNRATLAASTASLACDWGQTRSAASNHWKGRYEANPIMGTNPGTRTVDTYFASTVVLNAAIWYFIPEKLKSIIPGVVIGFQANTIAGNLDTTQGVCGL
jgi:hypothetical protein